MSTDWPTPTRPRPHPVLPWCGALFCVPGAFLLPGPAVPGQLGAAFVAAAVEDVPVTRQQLTGTGRDQVAAVAGSALLRGADSVDCANGCRGLVLGVGTTADRRWARQARRGRWFGLVCTVVGPGAAERAVRTQPAVSDGNTDHRRSHVQADFWNPHACLSRTPGRGAGGCAGWSSGGPTTSVCRADSAGLGLIAGCRLQRAAATWPSAR